MAATIAVLTAVSAPYNGAPKLRTIQWTGDSSYVTGGYSLVAADVGLTTIHNVLFSNTTTGFVPAYNFTTGKVQLFKTGTSADTVLNEVANAATAATAVLRITFIGD